MLKRIAATAFTTGSGSLSRSWRALAGSRSYSVSSAAVNSIILRSLKDHYVQVSKMSPPPKVNPPEPFTVVKGALDSDGPVLKRSYNNEEISVYVTRLITLVPGGGDEEDGINQLFVHVDVWKPGQEKALHFLCGLYPDALGIHSVTMRPRLENSLTLVSNESYPGPNFSDIDQKMKDALHNFIEERGINETLFPFLQAWLYVKDHRFLLRWFKGCSVS
ncbi:hypothetical protein V2J09_001221 [Rumex salicifolius]